MGSCNPMDTREALRETTYDVHERLHGHWAFRGLLAQTITLDEYRALLSRLYGFHQPLEVALCAREDLAPDLEIHRRRRACLLIDDLKALGGDASIADFPLIPPPQYLDSRAAILGCLYVREGATLGGRVLAGKLDFLLGPGPMGRRFFAGTGHDAALWRACCAAFEGGFSPRDRGAMIQAARETFAIFEDWINAMKMDVHREKELQ
jgi:heme oxygenase (biliverdin-IX-beta and delta-forming)